MIVCSWDAINTFALAKYHIYKLVPRPAVLQETSARLKQQLSGLLDANRAAMGTEQRLEAEVGWLPPVASICAHT